MEAMSGLQWLIMGGVGFLAGIVSSLLGVGSGIIMVPVLVLGFAFAQKDAQGMSLAVIVPMALIGAWRYHVNPEIKLAWSVILVLAALGVLGAFVGSAVAAAVPAAVLRRIFGVFIVVVGIKMLLT